MAQDYFVNVTYSEYYEENHNLIFDFDYCLPSNGILQSIKARVYGDGYSLVKTYTISDTTLTFDGEFHDGAEIELDVSDIHEQAFSYVQLVITYKVGYKTYNVRANIYELPLGPIDYDTQVKNKPFDEIGTGLTVTDGALHVDVDSLDLGSSGASTWSELSGKPFDTLGYGFVINNDSKYGKILSLNNDVFNPSWYNVQSKPFSYVGNGLEIKNDKLIIAAASGNIQKSVQTTLSIAGNSYIDLELSINFSGDDAKSGKIILDSEGNIKLPSGYYSGYTYNIGVSISYKTSNSNTSLISVQNLPDSNYEYFIKQFIAESVPIVPNIDTFYGNNTNLKVVEDVSFGNNNNRNLLLSPYIRVYNLTNSPIDCSWFGLWIYIYAVNEF